MTGSLRSFVRLFVRSFVVVAALVAIAGTIRSAHASVLQSGDQLVCGWSASDPHNLTHAVFSPSGQYALSVVAWPLYGVPPNTCIVVLWRVWPGPKDLRWWSRQDRDHSTGLGHHHNQQFPGAVGIMQPDGNFVLYQWHDGGPSWGVWSTSTHQPPGAWLNVQDDGNVVIYTAEGVPVWSIW